MAKELVTRGFTVYALDLRGRGDSNSIRGPFGMQAHAEDVLAVMNDIGDTAPVDLVGHSMGAFVVAALAGMAPERIKRAFMIDGGVPFTMPSDQTIDEFLPKVLGPALKRLAMKFPDPETYISYFRDQRAFSKGWSAALSEYASYDLRGDTASTNPACVAADSTELFGAGSELVTTGLHSLPSSTLVIRAERGLQDDAPLYPDTAVFDRFPQLRVVTLPDSNHYDIIMSPQGVLGCISLMYPQT